MLKNYKNFIAIIFIVLVGALFYAATIKGSIGNFSENSEYSSLTGVGQAFESSHERSPFAMLLAMKNNGTVELNKELADFSSPDVAYINSKFYSFFPPGIPALIFPLYEIGSQYDLGLVFSYATIPLLAIGVLVLLFLISRQIFRLPVFASVLSALIFAFATTSWSYATTIYQHIPLTFCLLLAFYSAWRFKNSNLSTSWVWGIVAGIAYATSVYIDYPSALLLLPVVLYLIVNSISVFKNEDGYKISWRASVLFGLVAIGIIAASHMYYNQEVFGNPLQFHNPAPRYTPETYNTLLESSSGNSTSPTKGFTVFSEEGLATGSYELLVAPDKGIFVFSIILILAFFGIVAASRKAKIETFTLLSFVGLNFIMYASFADPWGGWAFGPRYLIPTMAVLSLFVGVFIGTNTKIWKRILAFVLIAYSAGIALLGALTTNLVPPKVEAVSLNLKYGFVRNWDFLKENISSSFMYNTYFKDEISLLHYFLVLYLTLLIIFAVVLFVLPFWRKDDD